MTVQCSCANLFEWRGFAFTLFFLAPAVLLFSIALVLSPHFIFKSLFLARHTFSLLSWCASWKNQRIESDRLATPQWKRIYVWKLRYVTKLFGKVLQNYSSFALFKWNPNVLGIFLKNPPDGAGHILKCIESKNWHHFDFKTFLRPWTLLLCKKIVC